jgi:hypothetical protein
MTYKPNFNDPRTQQRVIRAIAFCKKYLREQRPQALGTRWIHHKDNFGNQQHPLSRYLREKLLICIDDRYNKDLKITKKYLLNESGLKFLEEFVDTTNKQTTYSVTHLSNKFNEELNTGIEYRDSSSRRWHWLQNQRRQEKQQVLIDSGLTHNYDIVCSCPNLLLQYSQQLSMDEYLFYINEYIKNRTVFRQQLSQETEVDEQVIKRLINGLFQGGQISAYTKSNSFLELNGDLAKIKFLQQHEFIIGLKQDIRVIWQYIKPQTQKRTKEDKNGRIRTLPISGKQKTALYRELERSVLDQVTRYLTETNNRYFLEHDGWTTADLIDQDSLRNYIKNNTGFDLEFDYELLIQQTNKQHIV